MSTAAPPTVPPHPIRTQRAEAEGASHLPQIPPRPKRLDRSISPGNYPRSPLNDPPVAQSLSKPRSKEQTDPIKRPPSVPHLPSVGQEGFEYANIQYESSQPSSQLPADAATQTRRVGDDLHLHAPKPSLPQASAKAQVQAVTRTDSVSAASHGLGKPSTPTQEEHDIPLRQVRTKPSFSRPDSSASNERRRSIAYNDDEQGPAALGMRVPINPLLGDVQAPSPAPIGSQLTPTHTGSGRRHHRTKSGREVFLPPGSYGLHGHGLPPTDRFDKDWYAKHPEAAQQEEAHGHGVYESMYSGRGNFALSSDDLNKLVRNTASRGKGFGASAEHLSYPDEQIGYEASEQYSQSHVASPNNLTKIQSNISQPVIESPLRKESFPGDDTAPKGIRKGSDDAIDLGEDEVHVTEPEQKYNKVTGGEESMHETDEMQAYPTEEHGPVNEHGYSVPILAEDEVAKAVGTEHLHPAVPPSTDRRSSGYEYEFRSSGDVTPSSRPSSRPGSIHGMHSLTHSLSRFTSHHEEEREFMHTPLEDVDEYEPLFPDEDSRKKHLSHAERFKSRPDTLRHRFPSQDIWEDTPSSAMYEATVSTPDLPAQTKASDDPAKTFETPAAEAERKGEPTEQEKKKLIPAEERLAKSKFAPHLRDDMPTRPGLQPRFPSQDIWEDSPDSYHQYAYVQPAPVESESKPAIPPRPANRSKLSEEISPAQAQPAVPTRPQKKYDVPPADAKLTEITPPNNVATQEPSPTEPRKAPTLRDRPKPQVPPRPAKKEPSLEGLVKTLSTTSTGSVEGEKTVTSPITKPKPAIPARPVGKFNNLKGNFMNDLNQKLGLGPPKEKEKALEPEVEESKPLEDARKGRARGPQRRAPAKSPSQPETKSAQFSAGVPQSIWHIDPEDGLLNVHGHSSQSTSMEVEDVAKEYMSDEKIAQMDNSTVADAPSALAIDTTEADPSQGLRSHPEPEMPDPLATSLATETAEQAVDPTVEPMEEKPDPLEHLREEDNTLSQRTTASNSSGHKLEREVPDPKTDVIPISQHTTATSGTGASLEKVPNEVEKRAADEPIELRDEQVSAPAPGQSGPLKDKFSSMAGNAGGEADIRQQESAAGADEPKEPMPQGDVDYKKLEEMTARADGKGHAPEEGTTKVVD